MKGSKTVLKSFMVFFLGGIFVAYGFSFIKGSKEPLLALYP